MNTNKEVLLEQLVEEVNDAHFKTITAYLVDGHLLLRFNTMSIDSDFEELEEALLPVVDELREQFDVDFDIMSMNGRTVALEVIA